jgi:hypothetical protein
MPCFKGDAVAHSPGMPVKIAGGSLSLTIFFMTCSDSRQSLRECSPPLFTSFGFALGAFHSKSVPESECKALTLHRNLASSSGSIEAESPVSYKGPL